MGNYGMTYDPATGKFKNENKDASGNPTTGNPATTLLGDGSSTTKTGWEGLMDTKGTGGVLLGLGNLGVSAYSTWMNAENQKFMQNYYNEQQKLAKADFSNNATSTNNELTTSFNYGLADRGINPNSDSGKSALANYMNQWQVKTTV
jgi:hypothetical protein